MDRATRLSFASCTSGCVVPASAASDGHGSNCGDCAGEGSDRKKPRSDSAAKTATAGSSSIICGEKMLSLSSTPSSSSSQLRQETFDLKKWRRTQLNLGREHLSKVLGPNLFDPKADIRARRRHLLTLVLELRREAKAETTASTTTAVSFSAAESPMATATCYSSGDDYSATSASRDDSTAPSITSSAALPTTLADPSVSSEQPISSSSSSSSSSFPPLSSSTRVAAPPLSSAVQASTPPSSPAANHSTRPIAYALNVLDSPPCSPQQPQQDEPRQEKKINKMPKTQKTKSPPPFMDPHGRSPPPRERLSSASSASSDVEDIVACSPKGTQRSGRGAAEETEAGSRAQSSKAHRQVQPNNANGRRRSPFSTAADSLQGARRRQSSGEGSEGTVDSDVEEEQQHGQCEEDGEREAGGGGCSQRKPSSRKPMDRDSDGEGTRRERKGGDRRKRKGGSVTQEWGEGEGGFQSAVKKEKASSLRKEYNPSASFAASPPEGTSRYPDNNGESDGDGSK
mmetsp:Transcript_31491/g.62868  ORF Transcript_31491/g.62868 Transcript_31491/m.62868 type:complete len:513 (-) Transcript_31491:231-1769(-)